MKGWNNESRKGRILLLSLHQFSIHLLPLGGLRPIFIIVMQIVYIGHSSQPKKKSTSTQSIEHS